MRRETRGDPRAIASDVRTHALYPHLQIAASAGALVYVPGGDVGTSSVAWVARSGDVEFLPLEERVYGMVDVSGDGRRVAVHVADRRDYILLYESGRGARRLPASESLGWPKLSQDGEQVACTGTDERRRFRLVVHTLDHDRPPLVIAESAIRMTASTWSADGRRLSFYEFPGSRLAMVAIVDGTPQAPQYLDFTASTHDISESGWRVYALAGINVRRLPVDARVHRISDVGTEPRWVRGASEVAYRRGNRWFASVGTLGSAFTFELPRMILQTEFNDSPGPSEPSRGEWRRASRAASVRQHASTPPATRHTAPKDGRAGNRYLWLDRADSPRCSSAKQGKAGHYASWS